MLIMSISFLTILSTKRSDVIWKSTPSASWTQQARHMEYISVQSVRETQRTFVKLVHGICVHSAKRTMQNISKQYTITFRHTCTTERLTAPSNKRYAWNILAMFIVSSVSLVKFLCVILGSDINHTESFYSALVKVSIKFSV